jgi:hypothetical protein
MANGYFTWPCLTKLCETTTPEEPTPTMEGHVISPQLMGKVLRLKRTLPVLPEKAAKRPSPTASRDTQAELKDDDHDFPHPSAGFFLLK